MVFPADDLVDWVADREDLLIAAWTPELSNALEWETPYAEAFAGELHDALITTFLRNGTEENFVNLVGRSRIGLDPKVEKAVAERFYNVTLKLARAAGRLSRYNKTRTSFPFLRGIMCCVEHSAFGGIVLPHDHPFWGQRGPPLDMECGCTIMQVSQGQLKRHSWTITSDDDLIERESRLVAAWPPAFEPLLNFRHPFKPQTAS